MTYEKDSKRSNEISWLYTFGVILTILGHSHPNDWTTFPSQPVEFIYSFHMPLFFCISGYLFAKSDSLKRYGYSKWLSDKSKRLLIPYFVISALSFIPKSLLENRNLNDIGSYELLECFFAPRLNVWGHFWFLPVIFIFYLLFGLWKSFLFDKSKHKKSTLIGMLLVSVILHFLKNDILWLGISDLCEFIVYFVIGIFAHQALNVKKTESEKLITGALILTTVSVLMFLKLRQNAVALFAESIFMLTVCLFLSQLLAEKNFKFVKFVNDNVFTFFIYSWPFQAIAEKMLNVFNPQWFIYTITMFLIGLISPCVIILFYKKVKFINCAFCSYLLGFRVE